MHNKTGSQQNSCLLIVKDILKYNGVHFSLLKTLVAFPVAQIGNAQMTDTSEIYLLFATSAAKGNYNCGLCQNGS